MPNGGRTRRIQVLESVHVVDEPGEEIAAAKRWETGRCQGLEARVDPHPEVGQEAERGLVPDEALPVAEEPPRQAEALHEHDGEAECSLVGAAQHARSAMPPWR